MTLALASRRRSTTMRIPVRSDSSLSAVMPSICLSRTRSAIFSTRRALFTWYGSSVTMMRFLPFDSVSIWQLARSLMMPRPVVYALRMPSEPSTMPAVGKSGPLMTVIKSSTVASGLSMSISVPSMTSHILCGGMFVAMPTAMPLVPLTRSCGNFAGRTAGSFSDSS